MQPIYRVAESIHYLVIDIIMVFDTIIQDLDTNGTASCCDIPDRFSRYDIQVPLVQFLTIVIRHGQGLNHNRRIHPFHKFVPFQFFFDVIKRNQIVELNTVHK
jgi:hypothetical protein